MMNLTVELNEYGFVVRWFGKIRFIYSVSYETDESKYPYEASHPVYDTVNCTYITVKRFAYQILDMLDDPLAIKLFWLFINERFLQYETI
jgi:hypothetical protein